MIYVVSSIDFFFYEILVRCFRLRPYVAFVCVKAKIFAQNLITNISVENYCQTLSSYQTNELKKKQKKNNIACK